MYVRVELPCHPSFLYAAEQPNISILWGLRSIAFPNSSALDDEMQQAVDCHLLDRSKDNPSSAKLGRTQWLNSNFHEGKQSTFPKRHVISCRIQWKVLSVILVPPNSCGIPNGKNWHGTHLQHPHVCNAALVESRLPHENWPKAWSLGVAVYRCLDLSCQLVFSAFTRNKILDVTLVLVTTITIYHYISLYIISLYITINNK